MSDRKSYFFDETWVPNFNLDPKTVIPDSKSHKGYDAILKTLKDRIAKEDKKKLVVVFDYYYGIDQKKMQDNVIGKLGASLLVDVESAKYPEDVIQEKFGKYITDDRIMGVNIPDPIDAFFCPDKLAGLQKQIDGAAGLVVVYGVAAAVLTRGDLLIYCEITHQEVAARFRKGLPNWGATNYDEDPLRKEKRDSFVEKRVQLWHKRPLLKVMDYLIDCTGDQGDGPVMMCGDGFRKAIQYMAHRPIQNTPNFTPAVWGGHWAQKVLNAKPQEKNIGWAMPGSLEMLPVKLVAGDNEISIPAYDLVLMEPNDVIGSRQFSNYGYKAPVIINYLDTWQGGNLSLQVHPTISYAQEKFNSDFGHHESYYMMDVMDDSHVYLGLKNGVTVDEFVDALNEAQETGTFDDGKYVNNIPMTRHDHIFIPGGTVHASGDNTVVLEIDIFGVQTFKLWDWGRIDFDGKPRPINIEHGANVINPEIDTDFTLENLVSTRHLVKKGYGWKKEFSGTNAWEPFSVYRYWFHKPLYLETDGVVKAYVLVEGREAVVESLDGSFEPFVFHYAENVFIPASVGQFLIKPHGESAGQEIAIVESYMNFSV